MNARLQIICMIKSQEIPRGCHQICFKYFLRHGYKDLIAEENVLKYKVFSSSHLDV